ncbi:MAG: hypothetical protein ACFCU8_10705 [Thermosynechococcaceae cyanobacterium]
MVNTVPQQTTADGWTPPMPPTDLSFDDGEPLETNQHRVAMNILIRSQSGLRRFKYFASPFVQGAAAD